jgi:hypothetical protein
MSIIKIDDLTSVIMPVPDDGQLEIDSKKQVRVYRPVTRKFWTIKKVTHLWDWYDEDHSRIGKLVRFDTGRIKNGKPEKTVLSLFYGEVNSKKRWIQCAWSVVKPGIKAPLFGSENLHKDLPVLVVEGEKTQEIVQNLLGDKFTVVCAHCGASRVKGTDWSLLQGKEVYISPDNDIRGFKAAMETYAGILGEIK